MSAISEFALDKFRGAVGFGGFKRRLRGKFFTRFLLKTTVFFLLPLWLLYVGYGLLFHGEGVRYKIAEFADMRVRDVSMEVTVGGNRVESARWNVSKRDVIRALGDFQIGQNIFGVSPEEIRQKISAVPWVKSATVRLRLPDTVLISVEERIPYALWQINEKFYLIDKEGAIITDKNPENYALPWIVGEGAEKNVQEYVEIMHDFKEIKDLVKAAYRVGRRRWNLDLYNGVEIALAERNPRGSLERLSALMAKHDILRKVSAIDLRLTDKTFVRLKDKNIMKTWVHGNEV